MASMEVDNLTKLAVQYFELIHKRESALEYERYHEAADYNDKARAIKEKLYRLHPAGEDAVADWLDEMEVKLNDIT